MIPVEDALCPIFLRLLTPLIKESKTELPAVIDPKDPLLEVEIESPMLKLEVGLIFTDDPVDEPLDEENDESKTLLVLNVLVKSVLNPLNLKFPITSLEFETGFVLKPELIF